MRLPPSPWASARATNTLQHVVVRVTRCFTCVAKNYVETQSDNPSSGSRCLGDVGATSSGIGVAPPSTKICLKLCRTNYVIMSSVPILEDKVLLEELTLSVFFVSVASRM